MRTGYFIYRVCLPALIILSLGAGAYGQVPRQISYQGLVVGAGGQHISDGSHDFEFKIYDSPTGSVPLYAETQVNVQTNAGIFNVILGTVAPFPALLNFDRQYWLGIAIDGTPEIQPRTALTSAPYALNAGTAEVAKGIAPDASGVVTSLNEIDGPVRIINQDSSISIAQSGNVITLSVNFAGMTNVPWDIIGSGLNQGQTLEVGDGSVLKPTATGIVEANRLSGATVSVDATSGSYAGRVKIPVGVSTLQVLLSPNVGCTANSSVTVSQFDQAGNEFLVGAMVTDVGLDTFTVKFSADYPTETGYISYLIVNP